MPESDGYYPVPTEPERLPDEKSHGRLSVFTVIGLAITLLPAASALSYWYLLLWPSGGNQYGANELSVLAAIVSLLLLLPFCAVSGLMLVYKNCSWQFIRTLSWVFMIPAIVTLLYAAARFCPRFRPAQTLVK